MKLFSILILPAFGTRTPLKVALLEDATNRGYPLVAISVGSEKVHQIPISIGQNIFLELDYTAPEKLTYDMTFRPGNLTFSVESDLKLVTDEGRPTEVLSQQLGTTLLMNFKSMTIIQNATRPIHLVLGVNEAYFNRHCRPGTFAATQVAERYIFGKLRFADEDAAATLSMENEILIPTGAEDAPSSIELDKKTWQKVARRLLEDGAVPVKTRYGQFANCKSSTLEKLDLVLDLLGNLEQEPSVTQVSIPAEDFIRHNPSTNTCILGRPTEFEAVFNPLKRKGLNLWHKQGEEDFGVMKFCQSTL